MAWEQNEMLREVSVAVMPTFDLNHWRSASTSEISAIGVPQMCDASSVRSSNAFSGSVSRMRYCLQRREPLGFTHVRPSSG